MRVVIVGDINEAYRIMMNDALSVDNGVRWRHVDSRNGPVMEYREPVTTVYRLPRNRVLFNAVRNANPFFHVMEALWMLAGRNDVEWISQFNSNIAQYSDDGKIFHGAYGYRWRRAFQYDQIDAVIHELQKDPESRRAVIAMWNSDWDIEHSKDLPCNTHIYFKVRDFALNMTVCNRSNDMIWGCYGANYVHFTFLMEYIAAHLDLRMGTYTHVSDSFHIYKDNPSFKKQFELQSRVSNINWYTTAEPRSITPLIESTAEFDNDLENFMRNEWREFTYSEPFFTDVAVPMRTVWDHYKNDNRLEALRNVEMIKSLDWKFACSQWIKRVMKWI